MGRSRLPVIALDEATQEVVASARMSYGWVISVLASSPVAVDSSRCWDERAVAPVVVTVVRSATSVVLPSGTRSSLRSRTRPVSPRVSRYSCRAIALEQIDVVVLEVGRLHQRDVIERSLGERERDAVLVEAEVGLVVAHVDEIEVRTSATEPGQPRDHQPKRDVALEALLEQQLVEAAAHLVAHEQQLIGELHAQGDADCAAEQVAIAILEAGSNPLARAQARAEVEELIRSLAHASAALHSCRQSGSFARPKRRETPSEASVARSSARGGVKAHRGEREQTANERASASPPEPRPRRHGRDSLMTRTNSGAVRHSRGTLGSSAEHAACSGDACSEESILQPEYRTRGRSDARCDTVAVQS